MSEGKSAKHSRFIFMAALGCVLFAALLFFIQQDNEAENTTDVSDNTPPSRDVIPYWQQPSPELPEVDTTALQPDAVSLDNQYTFPSLTYGLHTFFWWSDSYRDIGLAHLNQMLFSHIRQKFAWIDIEPLERPVDDPDRYVWAEADAMMADIEASGIEVVVRLGAAPEWGILSDEDYEYGQMPYNAARLVDYCSAVATRYQGRIAAYQIWNEPNLQREWGYRSPDPVAYVDLLHQCGVAIREADPEAIIISAGLAPTETRDASVMPHLEFLWKMYEAGASPYFDVMGVHAPGYCSPPEADPENLPCAANLPWMSFRHVEYMRAVMVASGDSHKQIAITEMGWTIDPVNEAYSWFAVTPEQQGDYLARAYAFAAENWRPWVGLMITIYYPNPAWTEADEEYWWAIGTTIPMPFGMDGRPAWPALWRMAKISSEPAYTHPQRDAYGNPVTDDTETTED